MVYSNYFHKEMQFNNSSVALETIHKQAPNKAKVSALQQNENNKQLPTTLNDQLFSLKSKPNFSRMRPSLSKAIFLSLADLYFS